MFVYHFVFFLWLASRQAMALTLSVQEASCSSLSVGLHAKHKEFEVMPSYAMVSVQGD